MKAMARTGRARTKGREAGEGSAKMVGMPGSWRGGRGHRDQRAGRRASGHLHTPIHGFVGDRCDHRPRPDGGRVNAGDEPVARLGHDDGQADDCWWRGAGRGEAGGATRRSRAAGASWWRVAAAVEGRLPEVEGPPSVEQSGRGRGRGLRATVAGEGATVGSDSAGFAGRRSDQTRRPGACRTEDEVTR